MSALLKPQKHPGGRPTKYNQSILNKARHYIENYEELSEGKEAIPSHDGLSKYLGISRTCLYDWATHEDKKEFSNILDNCNRAQAMILISKGLKGEFNSNITKLVLGKHGYTDKQDANLSGITINVDRNASIQLTDNGISISTLEQQADNTLETVIEHEPDKISND